MQHSLHPALFIAACAVSMFIRCPTYAAPWERLFTLDKVEADPNKDYYVTKENGPWMILACSFSGPLAEKQAKELVLELRKRYKLPAYIYKKRFKLSEGDSAPGYTVGQDGQPVRLHYRRGDEFEEIAVLVGDFPSVDDPKAQETLQKIKYAHPECLKLDGSRPVAVNLAAWRTFWKYVSPEKEKLGPMGKAFLVPNPLLPKEYFAPNGIDELVLKANEGVEYCLLDCPGKYTVQVATFHGETTMKQEEIARLRNQPIDPNKSKLVEAAEKAHKLTLALRMKGYEAYEFHDRYASIVTVGSFDWVTRKRPDGTVEFNPEIQAVIDRFKAKPVTIGGRTTLAQQTLVGIPFDIQPRVVYVPKRPVSSTIGRKSSGLLRR